MNNVEHAVGFPVTASATVCTLAAGTAYHVTFSAGAWYDCSFNVDVCFALSTDDTSATTNGGGFIKAGVVYSFYAPADYQYFSVIPQPASAGAGAVWPKRLID